MERNSPNMMKIMARTPSNFALFVGLTSCCHIMQAKVFRNFLERGLSPSQTPSHLVRQLENETIRLGVHIRGENSGYA